jgi:membrane protease subunit (stomatin/prohibitin family)
MKAAMALETASQTQGEAGAGMGLGMGFMMPAMFADAFRAGAAQSPQTEAEASNCPDCRQEIPRDAKFCHHCGHQILVFQQCTQCGKNLPANARFCVRCGRPVEEKPQPRVCPKCSHDNLFNAVFCNRCGERIDVYQKT